MVLFIGKYILHVHMNLFSDLWVRNDGVLLNEFGLEKLFIYFLSILIGFNLSEVDDCAAFGIDIIGIFRYILVSVSG
jgi:hypothetical protein